jgi:hypothetical protein
VVPAAVGYAAGDAIGAAPDKRGFGARGAADGQ